MRPHLVIFRSLFLGAFVFTWGCTPTCEQACQKILTCEDEGLDTPRMNLDECTSSCAAQSNWYEDEELDTQQAAFDELKSCIVAESCSDLAEGVCYDEDVYAW